MAKEIDMETKATLEIMQENKKMMQWFHYMEQAAETSMEQAADKSQCHVVATMAAKTSNNNTTTNDACNHTSKTRMNDIITTTNNVHEGVGLACPYKCALYFEPSVVQYSSSV
jgi:hypothetical protein